MINEKPGRPLLDYVLHLNRIAHDGPFEFDVGTLELVLRESADPNDDGHGCTVWGY